MPTDVEIAVQHETIRVTGLVSDLTLMIPALCNVFHVTEITVPMLPAERDADNGEPRWWVELTISGRRAGRN